MIFRRNSAWQNPSLTMRSIQANVSHQKAVCPRGTQGFTAFPFLFFFFPLMASLVSVTRYRKQIPWNNDLPVMVTNFNMLESISSELILVPRICTSFDWSRATLTFIKSITIKTESMSSFIYAISKIIRFMLFFTYYKFLNSDIPQNQ